MSAQLKRLLAFLAFPSSLLASLLLLSALDACASGPGRPGDAAAPLPRNTAALPGKPGCFFLVNFDGSWTALNQTQLLVYAPLSRPPYLIQLFEPVINLKFDERLGFEDVEHTGMICDKDSDSVVVPNFEPHRIVITAVHQVTRAQARALMLANGLKVPPQKAGS